LATLSFYSFRSPPDLHSFPTRRSSDLITSILYGDGYSAGLTYHLGTDRLLSIRTKRGTETVQDLKYEWYENGNLRRRNDVQRSRSEEHTSELQSRFDLVCRLLLEKKNK